MVKQDQLYLDVVNAHEAVFSGYVKSLQVTGAIGELGIYPGHTPLLTSIEPGLVSLVTPKGEQQVIYLSGGIVEVQPYAVNILADIAVRGSELDQEAALAAKHQAEQCLMRCSSDQHDNNMNYAEALKQLSIAIAQLRVMAMLRKIKTGTKIR